MEKTPTAGQVGHRVPPELTAPMGTPFPIPPLAELARPVDADFLQRYFSDSPDREQLLSPDSPHRIVEACRLPTLQLYLVLADGRRECLPVGEKRLAVTRGIYDLLAASLQTGAGEEPPKLPNETGPDRRGPVNRCPR